MSEQKSGTLIRAFSLSRREVPAVEVPQIDLAEETPAASTATTSEPPAVSRRRRPARGERMAVYLPPELAEELRVRCARERRSMSDAVSEAVGLWAQSRTGT